MLPLTPPKMLRSQVIREMKININIYFSPVLAKINSLIRLSVDKKNMYILFLGKNNGHSIYGSIHWYSLLIRQFGCLHQNCKQIYFELVISSLDIYHKENT